MQRLGIDWDASRATRAVLVFGLLFMLGANLPGHLSYDSLAQLSEGRSGLRETWGPATYAWILGFFDEIVPGTGLYVTASAALLFFSLSTLRRLTPAVSWWAVPATLLIVLSPQFLIYQAIVWKDVLFANLAVTGFVFLARAEIAWGRPGSRSLALAGAGLCLALAALVRQNGMIVIPFAALALGAFRLKDGWRQALTWSGSSLVVVLAIMQLLGAVTQLKDGALRGGPDIGIRILQHYDILGAVARDPNYPLKHIEKAAPASAAKIRAAAASVYSPERIDFVDRDPAAGKALWAVPSAAMGAEWRDLIIHHTGAYLAQRGAAFQWLLASPRLEACLPQYVGVSGPDTLVEKLKLTNDVDLADQSLSNYGTYFYGTPVYSHLAYAIVALFISAFLIWRRSGVDIAVSAMMISSLLFTASFFVISIACDYRYLYFLDLSAMVGVFYLALDPSLRVRPVARD